MVDDPTIISHNKSINVLIEPSTHHTYINSYLYPRVIAIVCTMIFSKLSVLNFVSTFLIATIFITIGDHIQSSIMSKDTHPRSRQPQQRSLRGDSKEHHLQRRAQQQEPIIPRHTPDFAGEDKLLEHLVSAKHMVSSAKGGFSASTGSSCSQHSSNENTCNSNIDEHGNECRYCTDHLSNKVCVPETSLGYKFAPCNNWICHVRGEPSKSDVTACERM